MVDTSTIGRILPFSVRLVFVLDNFVIHLHTYKLVHAICNGRNLMLIDISMARILDVQKVCFI
jgi:hypothetical protein